MSTEARFFTMSDSGFFVGTVALLNSLRLTGHSNELVVLDRGLTAAQRLRLARHATVIDFPEVSDHHPFLLKQYPAVLEPSGVVVIIDSDMIVTDSLHGVLARAAAGKICVFPDHHSDVTRWFTEWSDLLGLHGPLRREPYVNAGFMAVSTDHWPLFLRRVWDLCQKVGTSGLDRTKALEQRDQDVLNAILWSEFDADAVERLPAYEWLLVNVKVEDPRTLRCTSRLGRQPLLHAWSKPKLWQPGGWRLVTTNSYVRPNAYVRLLPRVLFGPDVQMRLEPGEVPYWARSGRGPRLATYTIGACNTLPGKARRAPRRVMRELRAAFRGSRVDAH